MPDWLRLRLIHELTDTDESIVRDLLRNLLEQQLEEQGSFALELAGTANDRDRDWRNVLRGFFNSEPASSALPDQVFVSFLFGKSANALQLQAPDGWRRFVFSRGIASLGMRPLFGAMLAFFALLASTLALELIALRDAPNSRTSELWVAGGPRDASNDNVSREWLRTSASSSVSALFEGQPLITKETQAIVSPDEQYLLSSQGDNWARLWRVGSASLIATIEQPGDAPILSMAFSREGQYIATRGAANFEGADSGQVWAINPQPQQPEQPSQNTLPLGESVSRTISTTSMFASGSALLGKLGQLELAKFAKEFVGRASHIAVTVHTDSAQLPRSSRLSGSENLYELSQARAQSIADNLGEILDVAPDQRLAVGRGADEPIASNETAAGRVQNRRADITITYLDRTPFSRSK